MNRLEEIYNIKNIYYDKNTIMEEIKDSEFSLSDLIFSKFDNILLNSIHYNFLYEYNYQTNSIKINNYLLLNYLNDFLNRYLIIKKEYNLEIIEEKNMSFLIIPNSDKILKNKIDLKIIERVYKLKFL